MFNSVALSIGRSPLDARWNQVSGAGVGGNAGAFAASLRDQDVLAKLEAVNGYVNARPLRGRPGPVRGCRPMARSGRHAEPRPWRLRRFCPGQARHASRRRRSGKDLYLVVLKDLSRRADHAVLVVRAAGRFLVLDNGTDQIVDSADVAGL